MGNENFQKDCQWARDIVEKCKNEVSKRIVGQNQVLDGILTAMVTGGHILLEGVPGLAKTLAVKTFADISGLDFKRIQFTPDLLPADVTGTLLYNQSKSEFSVRKGPVFTNLVLADEINRSPAKVQSALLEAMAERQVTIGEETYKLPDPFVVLATQNPIEQEGTYNLPEAELDRFLLKVRIPYPMPNEEVKIVKAGGNPEIIPVDKILNAENLNKLRGLADQIVCDDKIIEYIVSMVSITRPEISGAQKTNDFLHYITFGASPRASIALCKCAKARSLFQGRTFVLPEDVKEVAPSVLRHRLVLSYEAGADGVTSDELIDKLISFIPVP
ncbi:MAG: MoxR family ATPase [Treponemataceae bacterium]|nr:MoxR family ATPase [Treponemataceae bacterium]